MRRALAVMLAWLAPVALLGQAAPVSPVVPEGPASSAKVWVGRHAEFEEFLRNAPIERVEAVPVGVTRPKRAFFAKGGLAGSVVVKHLPMGQRAGFWEAYKSEIAAYELDRLLRLDMVPVTIERRVEGDLASAQLWVEGCRLLKDVDQKLCPRPIEWAKQVCRQRVFDNLVGNIDRNAGNMLVDAAWNVILIDHSRSFAVDRMPFEKEMTRIDRDLFGRLVALDEAGLKERVRPWLLSDGQMRGILKRRDRIVAHFERMARERGEAAVFPF